MYGSSIDISMTSLSFVSRIVGKFLVPSGLQSPTAVSIDFKTSNGHSIPSAIGFDCEVRRSTAMKYQLFDCEFVSGLLKVSGFVWYSLVVFGCGWMCKVVSGCIWQLLIVSGTVCLCKVCLIVSGCVLMCKVVSGSVWQCLDVYGCIWFCLIVSGRVQQNKFVSRGSSLKLSVLLILPFSCTTFCQQFNASFARILIFKVVEGITKSEVNQSEEKKKHHNDFHLLK